MDDRTRPVNRRTALLAAPAIAAMTALAACRGGDQPRPTTPATRATPSVPAVTEPTADTLVNVQARFDGAAGHRALVGPDHLLLLTDGIDGGRRTVSAHALTDGRELWNTPVDPDTSWALLGTDTPWAALVMSAGDGVYAVRGIDGATGRERWTTPVSADDGRALHSIGLVGGTDDVAVVQVGRSGQPQTARAAESITVGLAADTGRERWRVKDFVTLHVSEGLLLGHRPGGQSTGDGTTRGTEVLQVRDAATGAVVDLVGLPARPGVLWHDRPMAGVSAVGRFDADDSQATLVDLRGRTVTSASLPAVALGRGQLGRESNERALGVAFEATGTLTSIADRERSVLRFDEDDRRPILVRDGIIWASDGVAGPARPYDRGGRQAGQALLPGQVVSAHGDLVVCADGRSSVTVVRLS